MARDLTGQQFSRLTVIERASRDSKGVSQWLCRCNCSLQTVKVVREPALIAFATKSCAQCPEPEGSTVTIGQRFGKLTAVRRVTKSKWSCLCDCGREVEFYESILLSGARKSCGH